MPRLRPLWLLATLTLVAAACGDDGAPATPDADTTPPADADGRDILVRLGDLPGLVSATEQPTDHPGYRRFDIRLEQLVDHGDAAGQTFTQQMTLLHHDDTAPMVLVSTGYWNYYGDGLSELATVLHANQLVVEHRYFASSRPDPADWSFLTIEQAAADHHVITEAFKRIYHAAWLATGASKGGMTSVYHRRFWPDDVDGTVPYVAPQSFGAPDYGYDAFVDAVGTPTCRQALEDLEVEILTNRRAAMEQRATQQAATDGWTYGRVAVGPAVESAVVSLYWAFWQYYGIGYCDAVPATTASDDAVWQFLDAISGVNSSSDQYASAFEAYYFQAAYQLGYPGTVDDYLDGLLLYGDADYAGIYPVSVDLPAFDAPAMHDVDDWLEADGSRLLFVYGEWDPWSGGRFPLGDATDSLSLTVAEGTHGADLSSLDADDRAAAAARLEAWTGVTPDFAAAKR
ncbi:MAG: multidrug transporter, partial [Myxococcales bacterium]|nr:multidrug transporter [Myxococcales bacterium]